MQRQSVRSSNIKSVGYDERTMTLEIEFTSGEIYQYLNVPVATFQALMRASSHGRYLNEHIKDKYRFKRV